MGNQATALLNKVIRESAFLFLPLILFTSFFILTGLGKIINVGDMLSLVLPSCFVVFSLYLPLGINAVIEFRSEASGIRRSTGKKMDSHEKEEYLGPHQSRARFVLRAGIFAFISFLYPIISNIDEANILPSPFTTNKLSLWIDSFFISILLLVFIYISYIVLSLGCDYLSRSIEDQPNTYMTYFSPRKAIPILIILELVSISSLFSSVSKIGSGIWFASSIICAGFIILVSAMLN